MDQTNLPNWSNQPFFEVGGRGEVEEGEVGDDISDYSPGSLVIDHVEANSYSPVPLVISQEGKAMVEGGVGQMLSYCVQ